jgi:SpoIID/LytB domain protein
MPENEPLISVGILTDKQIEFELYGDFKSYGIRKTFSGRFSAELSNDKIIFKQGTERLEVSNEIIFEPQEAGMESFLIRNVTVGNKFHWQRKENERFIGSLKIVKNNNLITAINILPVEDYLTSVISSEMSAKSSIESLKTHAIISRSWLFSQIMKSRNRNPNNKSEFNSESEHLKWYDREEHKLFDFCNDDHCQRYHGITKVFTGQARQAIDYTRGIVLQYGEEICDARYSKCCGGITEAYENVWEPVKHEYLKPVVDYKFEPEPFQTDLTVEKNAFKWIKGNPGAFCNTHDKNVLSQILVDFDQATKDFFRWRVEYSQNEISEIIASKSGIDFGSILDLDPLERGASGRVIKLKITGSKRTLVVGKELEIRKFLSKTHLYSSAIVIIKAGDDKGIPKKFSIYGAGWGHGVGLCQIGAAVMASKGYMFDEILLHYFSGVKLKKIY